MKTITAKDLRDNLDSVVKKVRLGEAIKVTYRSKPAFILQPDTIKNSGPEPGTPEAMERFIKSAENMRRGAKKTVFDPKKSIKELYHEMLDNDPKYKPPYHR
jgi:antitoxin (DNA-binding transcriptional repressor) of toxin-antitoxin stability system